MKSELKKNKDEAWKWFSILIRLTYANIHGIVFCYTCGRKMFWKGEGAQAGHFQGGRGSGVLFEAKGVRVQCYACNCGRGGEQYKFGKNLEEEIGEAEVRKLEQEKYKMNKYTAKEYKAMSKVFKIKAEEIAKEKRLEI